MRIRSVKAGIEQQLPVCINFGVVAWDRESDYLSLFGLVDEQVYAMKRKHKRQMAQFMRE